MKKSYNNQCYSLKCPQSKSKEFMRREIHRKGCVVSSVQQLRKHTKTTIQSCFHKFIMWAFYHGKFLKAYVKDMQIRNRPIQVRQIFL